MEQLMPPTLEDVKNAKKARRYIEEAKENLRDALRCAARIDNEHLCQKIRKEVQEIEV